jgi:triacylglycerol lipase
MLRVSTVVLHHGLWARPGPVSAQYWRGIDQALAMQGYDVLVTEVHRSAGVAVRAAQLKQQVLRHLKRLDRDGQKVAIVAHGVGGLDARFAISKLGMEDRVAGLVTIGTPHRGSAYFDWVVRNLDRSGKLKAMARAGVEVGAVWDATTWRAQKLTESLPDLPHVKYFSVCGVVPKRRVPPAMFAGYSIITAAEGDNDGRVSLASAQWGKPIGFWPMHHFQLINWPLAQLPNDSADDVRPRYVSLVDQMIDEGVYLRRRGGRALTAMLSAV